MVGALDRHLMPTGIGSSDVLNSRTVIDRPESSVQSSTQQTPVRKLVLKGSRRELPDEDIRRVALLKLQSLILSDQFATQLGTSLGSLLEDGLSHDATTQSFADCFRMKASSTLQKRASSLQRLVNILAGLGVDRPFRLTESELYAALCEMRATGAGATSAQHIIESLFFLEGTVKFLLVDINAVVSGRCRGVARDMYLGKHPLSQQFPLSVSQVRILEEAMNHEPSFVQCILGQLLFCIHACCRWKDAQRLRKLSIEFSEEESLLYADAISSKTSLSLDARTRFLPYVALGHGVTGKDWASRWLQARQAERLGFDDCALPSFSERKGCWVSAPMSASEGTCWLREVLGKHMSDWDPRSFGSHSCKTTLLTWAGRSVDIVFTPAERRLLGHHLDPGMKSVATYARESYTTLYAKVLQMFVLIRAGMYNPDLPALDRVLRIASCAGPAHPVLQQPDPGQAVANSDSESSVASDAGNGSPEDARLPGIDAFPDFPQTPIEAMVVHNLSGLVHVVNEDDHFICGRRLTGNFKCLKDCPVDIGLLEGCSQCKRVYQREM